MFDSTDSIIVTTLSLLSLFFIIIVTSIIIIRNKENHNRRVSKSANNSIKRANRVESMLLIREHIPFSNDLILVLNQTLEKYLLLALDAKNHKSHSAIKSKLTTLKERIVTLEGSNPPPSLGKSLDFPLRGKEISTIMKSFTQLKSFVTKELKSEMVSADLLKVIMDDLNNLHFRFNFTYSLARIKTQVEKGDYIEAKKAGIVAVETVKGFDPIVYGYDASAAKDKLRQAIAAIKELELKHIESEKSAAPVISDGLERLSYTTTREKW